jgi:hypothetical protein
MLSITKDDGMFFFQKARREPVRLGRPGKALSVFWMGFLAVLRRSIPLG